MYQNIIFDLVGVVADFGTKRVFEHFIQMGAQDVWELNDRMDRGELRGEDFLQLVCERCPGTTVETLREEYLGPMILPVELLQRLCELRKQHKVFLLSNVGDMHWQHLVETMAGKGYRLEDCFDGWFPSFVTHHNKPEEAAYLHVLQTAKIKAEETAFFDDSPANVEAAIRLGIHAEVMKTQFTQPLAPSWPWLLS